MNENKKLTLNDKCYIHGCIAEIVGETKDNFSIAIEGVYENFKPKTADAKILRSNVDTKFEVVSINVNTGLRIVHQGNPVTQYSVPKKDCEQLISEVYAIGDKIETTLKGGGMIGTIQAFEYHNNRAACMSIKIGAYRDDRTRYSYKPHELSVYVAPNKLQFDIGSAFIVDGELMHVIQTSTNCLGLMDDKLIVRLANVPKCSSDKEIIKQYGLSSIKQVELDDIESNIIAIII